MYPWVIMITYPWGVRISNINPSGVNVLLPPRGRKITPLRVNFPAGNVNSLGAQDYYPCGGVNFPAGNVNPFGVR